MVSYIIYTKNIQGFVSGSIDAIHTKYMLKPHAHIENS